MVGGRLCELTRDVSRMSGAGVMIMSGATPQGSLCTADPVSSLIEELQFTLGEGPCVGAYHQSRVVSEADLDHPVSPRWLACTPKAVLAGVRGLFAFPLRVGQPRSP